MSVSPGDPIPDLSLPATGDQVIALRDIDSPILVLYFYPKDSTPGCTTEGRDFAERHAAFQAAGATILGASKDSIRRHENFKAKQEFPFELLSDEDETLCQAMGVIREKKMYGRTFMGIVRSTFVFADGKLDRVWSPVKVKGHAQEVLEHVQQLAA